MHVDTSVIISVLAIIVMAVCLFQVLSLRRTVPGGIVGRTWKQLTALVVLFFLGFLVTPFFSYIPQAVVAPIVALIFLFGAIYVWITIRLIHRVISELAA